MEKRIEKFEEFIACQKARILTSEIYHDAGYLNRDQFAHLIGLGQEVAQIIGGSRAAVERKRDTQKHKLSTQSSALST